MIFKKNIFLIFLMHLLPLDIWNGINIPHKF